MGVTKLPPPHLSILASRFMSFIIFWNHAESCAKQIAQLLLGENSMTWAITAEIGNRSLVHALQVASYDLDQTDPDGIGQHLRHFGAGYETLLGYRNFYVHSIFGTRPDPSAEGHFEAILFSNDGKGRARFFNQALTVATLEQVISHISALMRYGTAIQKELGATGDGIDGLAASYQASLEKPTWPPQVEKTPLYLQGQEPPPQSPGKSKGTRKTPPPN